MQPRSPPRLRTEAFELPSPIPIRRDWFIIFSMPILDAANEPEPAYHLFLDSDEVSVTARALRLLISDEAHEPQIRGLAREVLANLDAPPGDNGKLTVPLSPEQMKITHSAARLLLDDLQREQAGERGVLRRVLDKLPDEHTMRAITLR
jgi:hypothetical protein